MSRSNSKLERRSLGFAGDDAALPPERTAEIEDNVRILSDARQEKVNNMHRFGLLALGGLMCLCCSFSYAFNLISQTMRDRYSLDMRDITNISLAGAVFQYFVIPYAFLYDAFGPIPSCILGLVYSTIGFVCLSLCFSDKITGSVVRLCVFNAFTGSASTLFDQVGCVTVVGYFPNRRGPVIALLKSLVGLGSAIVGGIYAGFFGGDVAGYFMFLMALSIAAGLLGIIFMRQAPYLPNFYRRKCWSPEKLAAGEARMPQYLRQEVPFARLIYAFVILIILIIFIPLTSALNGFVDLPSNSSKVFAIIIIILTVLFFCLWIPTPWDRFCDPEEADDDLFDQELSSENVDAPELMMKPVYEEGTMEQNENALNDEPVIEDRVAAKARPHARVQTEVDFIAPQYQTSFLHNLCTIDLWCILIYLFCIGGTELTVISNARFLMESLSGRDVSDAVSTLQTVLNGAGSAIGRLCMAYLEYYTQQARGPDRRIPLTFALFIPAVFLIIGMILFMTLKGDALLVPYVLVALANGFQAASTVLIARTLYAKDPAKHYNFCFVATTLSVIVLHRFLYGEWYAVQAEKVNQPLKCLKRSCSMMPLGVLLGLCVLSFGGSFVVHIRYSRFCKRVMAERSRVLAEANGDEDTTGAPDAYRDQNVAEAV